ncbi:MAG TPA: extracellular solute-binding protein [Chloroflexota bacterium]
MRPGWRTRRQFLVALGGVGFGSALLAACGGSGTTALGSTSASASASASSTLTAAAVPTIGTTTSTAVSLTSSAAAASSLTTAASSAASSASASTTASATAVTSSATSSSSVAVSAAPGAAKTAVQFLWVDTGQKVWQDSWNTMLSGFSAANGGVQITRDTVQFAKASEKALTTYAGGGYYDYLYGYFGWLSGFIQHQVIQPLDQFLATDKSVSASDFYPAATEHYQGKLYGLAWFTNGKEIWYNADLFKQAGMQTPRQMEQAGTWTWQALLDAAQKLTKSSGGQTSVYGYDNSSLPYLPDYWMIMWAWGAAPYSADFKQATFNTKEQTDALQFASDFNTKYKVAGGGDFTKATLAMLMTGSFEARTVQDQIVPKSLFTVEIAPLPKGPTGLRPVDLANNCNYIGAGAKQPEQAWALNKYLLSAAAQPQIAQLGGGRYAANKNVKPVTLFPFEDANVYQQSIARSQGAPLILHESDIEKDWSDNWKSLTTGTIDVNNMLTTLQQKATAYLKDGGCVC